jgi:hypothetical protein
LVCLPFMFRWIHLADAPAASSTQVEGKGHVVVASGSEVLMVRFTIYVDSRWRKC